MNISTDFKINPNKYDYWDLDNGTVFLSFDRDSNELEPAILMKVVEERDNYQEDKYYVLDLQNGHLYSDVIHYPVDKIVDQQFTINI